VFPCTDETNTSRHKDISFLLLLLMMLLFLLQRLLLRRSISSITIAIFFLFFPSLIHLLSAILPITIITLQIRS
jgi:hypothetical protein